MIPVTVKRGLGHAAMRAGQPIFCWVSEKYNQTVKLGAEKGYRVANYMPLVPIERISNVFEVQKGETETVATNENGVAAAY